MKMSTSSTAQKQRWPIAGYHSHFLSLVALDWVGKFRDNPNSRKYLSLFHFLNCPLCELTLVQKKERFCANSNFIRYINKHYIYNYSSIIAYL